MRGLWLDVDCCGDMTPFVPEGRGLMWGMTVVLRMQGYWSVYAWYAGQGRSMIVERETS